MLSIRLLLISLLLFTTPCYAVGVQNIRVFPDRVELDGTKQGNIVVYYADIQADQVTQANADKATAWLQANVFDTVIKRNTLPADDPDRLADPNRANAFWSAGSNITYRNTLVKVFIQNGLFNVALCSVDYNDPIGTVCDAG